MLESSRLHLRPVKISDADELYQLNLDPEVIRFTGDKAFSSILETRNFITERMIPQFEKTRMSRFMVFLKDNSFTGWCGLKFHPETNEVDLGYRFARNFWGQGLATESSKLSLDYGFRTLGLERIIAKAMPENTASIKVMQKLGMTFKGYGHDPTDPHPFVLFEILKGQWKT